jgi:ribonuclease HI
MASDRLYVPPLIDDRALPDIVVRKNRRAFSYIRVRRGGEVKKGQHIAISVGGACSGLRAQAGMGVYFGPGSRYSMSEPLEDGQQTSQRAEINAAILALNKVKELLDKERLNTNLVLLATNSKYVVDCITEYIYRWQDNGWKTRRGSEVVNKEDFEELDELIDELEDDYDVFVKFWWVPKEFNEEADELAKEAAGFYNQSDSDDSSD